VWAYAHPLHRSERERERENAIHTIITTRKLKANEIKLEIIYKRVRKRERGREGERERCRILFRIVIFIFKGMMGALAPFSYIVLSKAQLCIVCRVVMLHHSFVNISSVINLY
jgi:hypothetical protein